MFGNYDAWKLASPDDEPAARYLGRDWEPWDDWEPEPELIPLAIEDVGPLMPVEPVDA